MPKRKKVILVTLTHKQRARLEKLWFYVRQLRAADDARQPQLHPTLT